jgi:hypothetical protein
LFRAWRSCIAGVNLLDEEREEEEALDFRPPFALATLEGVEWEEDMTAHGWALQLVVVVKERAGSWVSWPPT